jgi:hypothetical protein
MNDPAVAPSAKAGGARRLNNSDRWLKIRGDRQKQAVLFYLNSEIVRSPPGHVQVWVKAIDYGKLNKAMTALGPKDGSFKNTVAKIMGGYAPPFGTVAKLSSDDVVGIVTFEACRSMRPATKDSFLGARCA